MNIYRQMAENVYNPKIQSGADIQRMLDMMDQFQGKSTQSNINYAMPQGMGMGQEIESGDSWMNNPAISIGMKGLSGIPSLANYPAFSPSVLSGAVAPATSFTGQLGQTVTGLNTFLPNLAAGQSDFNNPYSGYLSNIPLVGQVLGGFLDSWLGKGNRNKQQRRTQEALSPFQQAAQQREMGIAKSLGMENPIQYSDIMNQFSQYGAQGPRMAEEAGALGPYRQQTQKIDEYAKSQGLVPEYWHGQMGGVFTPSEKYMYDMLLNAEQPNMNTARGLEAERMNKYYGKPYEDEEEKWLEDYKQQIFSDYLGMMNPPQEGAGGMGTLGIYRPESWNPSSWTLDPHTNRLG